MEQQPSYLLSQHRVDYLLTAPDYLGGVNLWLIPVDYAWGVWWDYVHGDSGADMHELLTITSKCVDTGIQLMMYSNCLTGKPSMN